MRIPDPAAGIIATVLLRLEAFSFFDMGGKQPFIKTGPGKPGPRSLSEDEIFFPRSRKAKIITTGIH
jgi:hypothetical protein